MYCSCVVDVLLMCIAVAHMLCVLWLTINTCLLSKRPIPPSHMKLSQTSTKLYLVLDFINGGHLFFQLYRQGIFSEELTRLYTAEMVLAIAHLHSLGFVHRDLKVRVLGDEMNDLKCCRPYTTYTIVYI